MSFLGGALGLAGGALSAIGGAQSARAGNQAGANAASMYQDRTFGPQLQSALQMRGGQGLADLVAGMSAADKQRYFGTSGSIDASTSRMQQIQDRLSQIDSAGRGSNVPRAQRDAMAAEKQRLQSEYKSLQSTIKTNNPGQYDLGALQAQYGNSKGFLGDYQDTLNKQMDSWNNLISGYQADTNRLTGNDAANLNQYDQQSRALSQQGAQNLSRAQYQTEDLTGEARKFGAGRADIINRDTQRQLDNANASSRADMIASGLGSSTLTQNAMAQNARAYGDVRQNALQNLSDSQLGAIMAAKQFGYGNQNQIGQANLGVASQRASGRTALQESQQGRLSGRLTGGTALASDVADKTWGAQSVIPQMQFAAL